MYKPWERLCKVHVHFKGTPSNDPIITEDMKAEAEVASAEWNRYVTDHLPMEQKYIASKTDGSAFEKSQLRGQVNADMAQASKGLGLTGAGMDPSRMLVNDQTGALSGKTAKALTDVTQSAGQREVQELGNLVAMGRGQQTEAMNGISELAASSADAALTEAKADQAARFAGQNATAKLVGSAANLATTGLSYGADQGWFKQAAPALSTTGNTYAYDANSGSFNVTPKPAATTGLLNSRLTY